MSKFTYAKTTTDATTGIILTLVYRAVSALKEVFNPRFIVEGIEDLADSVKDQEGIINPLWVATDGEVLQGHRRLRAIVRLFETSPAIANAIFPDGVPCYETPSGTGRALLDAMKMDDSNKGEILSTAYECQRSANLIFDNGGKEGDVAVQLDHLIARTARRSSVDSDVKDQLKAVREKLTNAEGEEYESLRAEERKLIKANRRGQSQKLHYGYTLRFILNPIFEYTLTGQTPEGYTGPVFKVEPMTEKVQTLHKAHVDDLKDHVDDDGLPIYSGTNPGPKVKALLAKWSEAHANPKTTASKKRAMSAKDIDEKIKSMQSRFARLLLKQVSDGTIAEDSNAYLLQMDAFLANFELCGADVQSDMENVAAEEAQMARALQAEVEENK